ncbi:MAG TPA: lamin tail domain-containing protein [Polyangiaceae bacterium]|nr:lamin tail domain-containing protein [Polyangiaceae bacterium]
MTRREPISEDDMPRSLSALVSCVVVALSSIVLSACSSDASPSKAVDASTIAFNEISAAGDEWLELYNTGTSELDLSGYGITDTDKVTGEPRVTKAMRFPNGTKLPKGGFALVLLDKSNSTPGPYSADACLPGVAKGCFYALFSVSEARGEAVHLLAADNSEVSSIIYPADLSFEAGTGLTACRIPDGSGALTTCTATPGTVNASP